MHEPSASSPQPSTFVKNVHGVRYQVKDVARSAEFYTRVLGFKLVHPDGNPIELFEPAQ